MKIAIVVILLLLPIWGCQSRVLKYRNSYQGLVTGKTTMSDTQKILGDPLKVDLTSNGRNYHYENLIINFSAPNRKTINTIIIFGDLDYKTSDGIQLGTDESIVRQVTGLPVSKVMADTKNGVCYWIKDNKVVKITLTSSLLN